jgi:hypothetical protein
MPSASDPAVCTTTPAKTENKQLGSGRRARKPSRVAIVAAVLWVVGMVGLILVYDNVASSRLRTLLVAGMALLIVVGLLAVGAWVVRGTTTVLQAVAMAFLLATVFVFSLMPVIFLGTTDRILLLKLGAIGFLSSFPGLLFVQFVAVRAETLRAEYVLHLHRLQADTYELLPAPPKDSVFRRPGDTRPEIDLSNLYIQKFHTVYGVPIRVDKASWAIPQNRGGILLLSLFTAILAVGWTLTIQPEPISTDQILRSVTLSGEPFLPTDALRFAFLGAYVFVIEVLVRRYFQDDLKAGAYLTCAERILTAILFVTAIHQVWPWDPGQEAAFAFLVGVFPMVGVRALQSLVSLPLRGLLPNLRKDYPLSDLDGLNIWYESRLLEEGIEDMENLSTANIVDVMLRMRVPVNRLVDWIDQSLLYLRVKDQEDRPERTTLRRLGIRTATDLEDALHPVAASRWMEPFRTIEPAGYLKGIQEALNGDSSQPSITVSIWKALAREPNLYHVRRWKEWGSELHKDWDSEGERDPVPQSPVPIDEDSSVMQVP